MYELVIELNGEEKAVFAAEDIRLVELRRQRYDRSLAIGEANIRESKVAPAKKAEK